MNKKIVLARKRKLPHETKDKEVNNEPHLEDICSRRKGNGNSGYYSKANTKFS